ncbi:MAG: arabinofuranan 3-O-arabinosyltransferase [Solirubrobacteraceae bacterium]|nr:arabinofuranan 3-O-arabinosyltransferase [Solirubrobacteraceae bacterium]
MTRRERAIPAALALGAFALALLQRPGWASSDTKIDLHVSPGRFLGDVASVWTQSGSLGHVQGGQYGGYLFPMGPFFALGHALGLAPWLVQRLWLGALLALAAWGTVRLLDDLAGRPRGAAHVVAGAMMVLNPYVLVFTARTSVTLLAYAALPWLLAAVHRGVRRPRGWWWPAVFALAVTASGGGVNAAVTAWVLLGPALLAAYELLTGVPRRAVLHFALRTIVLTLVVSLWWIGPILAQARYGIDFLEFTEQQGSIWGTTSLSETLRLMGYWVSYIGVGFHGATRPYFSDAATLLYAPAVVAAGLAVPALALGGFAWTRRARYGPFFLALALGGALVMVAGFPEGTPLRNGLNFTYNHVSATHFLRTSYKAGPLVALGLAGLGGLGAAALWARLPRPGGRVALAGAGAVLLGAAAWPLVRGDALDEQLLWRHVPAAWTQAGRDLDRDLPRQTRAVVAPGELFAYYRWGGTIDPILPALTRRPVAVRNIVPFADLRAIDAHWTVDGLVGQDRLVPGQLAPLLRWLGTGALVANADGDITRSGQPPPADAARVLARQGYGRPDRAYGPVHTRLPGAGELAPAARLAQVRRYDVAGARRIVRVAPLAAPALLDGSADAVSGLAAFGPLPGALAYAADRDAGALRRAAGEGAEVVISDSNRRQVFIPSRLEQNRGAVLAPGESPSEDAAILDPFPDRGSDAQTVALYRGVRSLRSPFSPGGEQYPEHRPFAAFDGDPRTAWLADRFLQRPRRWVEVRFERPRDVPYVDVLPENDRYGIVRALAVAGRRFAVHPGWNRLRLDLRGADRLRLRIAHVDYPPQVSVGGAGGLYEVRVPGLRVRESLRPPVVAERALAGTDLRRSSLTYLFQRTTGDEPFRRGRFTGPPQALLLPDRGDAETGLSRTFRPPAARDFRADAWATVSPDAPDPALDALAGARGGGAFASASRFEGLAGRRASRAFDGDPGTAWLGQWVERAPAWIAWETPRPETLTRLQLARPGEVVRFPTRVTITARSGRSGPVAVSPDGTVVLPRPLRGRRFRMDVVSAAFPRGATPQERTRRAVGIAEISGPGVPRSHVPRDGAIRGRCGDLAARVAGRTLAMRVAGSVRELDAGVPLRAGACGPAAALPASRVDLEVSDGLFRPYWLRLASPAPRPVARAAVAPGAVTDLGRAGHGRHDGVRVRLRAPALLVLGESFNRGWRAYCDGHSLGKPEPADGYANGWRAPASCRSVRFAFAPQRAVNWGYAISALAGLLLLGFLLLRRPGPETVTAQRAPAPEPDPPARLPWPRALAFAAAAAAVLGFVFALRAGVAVFPVVALVLRYGVGGRALALAGGALLALEPVIYLAFLPREKGGGYNFNYPLDLVGAHWVAVAGFVLLALSLWRRLNPSFQRRIGRSTR